MSRPGGPSAAGGCLRSLIALLVFGALGFLGLDYYLDRVYWGVAPSWYRIERDGDQVIFGCQNFAPVRFAERPAPGVRRILVLGGSTSFGYPERPVGERPIDRARHGLVGAMQAALDAAWPGAYELLDLGVNGGSSEDSLRILRRALGWGASGVVIYDGHNEYMTAPRDFRPGLWRFALSRRLAPLAPKVQASPGWVGRAAYGGPAHEAAILRQLRRNLEGMADALEDAGLPGVIATQAGNLRGFDPSWSTAGDPAALAALGSLDDAALEALWAAQPEAADVAWALGRRRSGAAAVAPLRAAADRDGMPFRATSAVNEQIRELAEERGLVLVDAEAAARGGGELPGNEGFYDWVHPRPALAARLSGALLEGMVEAGMLPERPPPAATGLSEAERLEASVRTARSWLQWSCVRGHDPGYRLEQSRIWAGRALEQDPDQAEARAILEVARALGGQPAELPTDPALRERLSGLHPCIAALF